MKSKHVFWEALIITIFIFGIGILLGIFIENSREDRLEELFLISESNLLDVKIQTELLSLDGISCGEIIEKNLEFGDKVYEDALILERYGGASSLKDTLEQYHRKYDLLRTLLWVNSIKIKEKCGEDSFHTVVYLYNYDSDSLTEKNIQKVFSKFLEDLKNRKGDDIVLIPIAKNMDISSLELLINGYDLGDVSIILDESLVVSDAMNLGEIDEAID